MDHAMESDTTFEPGSTVVLRSGGPGLTVLGRMGDRVQCVFFSEEIGDFRETSLPAIALMAADYAEGGGEEEEEDADESADGSAEDSSYESEGMARADDQPGDGKTTAAA